MMSGEYQAEQPAADRYCPVCNAEVDEDDRVCPSCGAVLPTEEMPSTSKEQGT
jgi:predicted nucleic acid-binding Zn ribbon protein